MMATVYSLPVIRLSKKGSKWAKFAACGQRGKIFQVLAFGAVAESLAAVDRTGEKILLEGEIELSREGEEQMKLKAFSLPERRIVDTKKIVSDGESVRPYKMWTDDRKQIWVRWL